MSGILLLFAGPARAVEPDHGRMAADVRALAEGIGPRPAGSPAEEQAARFIAARFEALGYAVRVQPFRLPNGRISQNVIADATPGPPRLIVGGHYDSRRNTPGADDNASGIAVILEVARLLAGRGLPAQFIAFGSEEMIDRNRDHHHYGSRHYVATASPELLRGLAGMLCVDAVGTGPRFRIEGMPGGNGRLARWCRQLAWYAGLRPAGGRGTTLSDHEAFARAGVPVALYHRVPNRRMHTPYDTPDQVGPEYLRQAAAAVLAAVLGTMG